jgi:hypothetical protein
MTFNDFCRLHRATNTERDWLAWHFAMMRAKALYELLR